MMYFRVFFPIVLSVALIVAAVFFPKWWLIAVAAGWTGFLIRDLWAVLEELNGDSIHKYRYETVDGKRTLVEHPDFPD
jgi:hypothetical protein